MGCCCTCFQQTTMFRKNSRTDDDAKAKLERKLYLAKESPEPIFDLSDCQIKQVPSGIFSICKVYRKDRLYLNNNKLESLESGGILSHLLYLEVLNISSNRFTSLSNDIKYLINLQELYLNDNQIRHLPDALQYLVSLKILDISNNDLKELIPAIGKLKALRKLKLNGNPSLNKLCRELCHATNIVLIELDGHNFVYPPAEVAIAGTEDILRFLSNELNIEYIPPSDVSPDSSPMMQRPALVTSPFVKQSSFSWEDQEAAMVEQEHKIYEESKKQRGMFLSQVLKEQSELDAEIAKVQVIRETDRQKLIEVIREEEKEIEALVNNFLLSTNLNPDVIQQELEYEQLEHDRLIEMCRQNYDNIRKNDILKAMETLIEEECAFQMSMKNYDSYLGDVKQSMLLQELESSEKLVELFKTRDEAHDALLQELLEDQDVQKAVVASLLERVDAKSWSLNQEIAIITSNLAKLSTIEQEKQKLQVTYNYNQLLDQRVQLLSLLDDLLVQQNVRRTQLVDTLKEMESEAQNKTNDFWLKNYQSLLDSAPISLVETSKNLDPQFANYLIEEGVIYCLPFLVKFIFSGNTLEDITSEQLKENGVSLSSDREGILRAIKSYVEMRRKNIEVDNTNPSITPSAPPPPSKDPIKEENICGVVEAVISENSDLVSECVVCMDAKCEIVFVPCGHLCCCQTCGNIELQICPMCRGTIERKIKVLIP